MRRRARNSVDALWTTGYGLHTSIGGDHVARPARVVPDSFQCDPVLARLYTETEPKIAAFIRRKAKRWSHRIPGSEGDVDDLVQEGRCAVMVALPKFDPNTRPLTVYMGAVLDKCYAKILRDVLAQKRTPHIDEWDVELETWRTVPCPTIPVDPTTIQAMSTTDVEGELIRGQMVAQITDLLYDRLTDIQAHVLDCYLSPEPELYFTARNLSGQYTPNVRHIAMFLKVPVTQVEYAVKKIRAEARAIIERLERE